MAVNSLNQRCRVVASGRKGNLARAFLDTAPMDGHDDRLCFSIVRGLFFNRLAPLMTLPALCIGRSFDVATVIIERCHGAVGVGPGRHVIDLLIPVLISSDWPGGIKRCFPTAAKVA